MSHYLRYLRIAFSVTCGVACVLVLVLWVRSYWWEDRAWVNVSNELHLVAFQKQGQLHVIINDDPFAMPLEPWGYDRYPIQIEGPNEDLLKSVLGFGGHVWPFETVVLVPHWSLVAFSALIVVLPWIHWSNRFSLRTLLIATTLIAVALGTIIALSQ